MRVALAVLAGAPDSRQPSSLENLQVSSLYRTRPDSEIPQPDFLNLAATATTRLEPAELLAVLKACEHLSGRRRSPRWGPRPLDLDLLIFGDLVVESRELQLPHPRLRQRRFYLEPLAQIAPDLRVPPDGPTVAGLLGLLPDDGVDEIEWRTSGPWLGP